MTIRRSKINATIDWIEYVNINKMNISKMSMDQLM